jgi:hypothetical protein
MGNGAGVLRAVVPSIDVSQQAAHQHERLDRVPLGELARADTMGRRVSIEGPRELIVHKHEGYADTATVRPGDPSVLAALATA